MPASEARIAAARINGARSRGPTSPEGKAISRANSYRHGMAGEGVVLAPDEAAEVARRSARMQSELAPKTEMGRFLVDRLAESTVRVQRCSRQERAAAALRARHAAADFDEARLAEVNLAIARVADDPAALRKLRSMPEGVERLISELLDLADDLETARWDRRSGERLALLGNPVWTDAPAGRVRGLSDAILGDFSGLRAEDGAGLAGPERSTWARDRVRELIVAEVEALMAHQSTIDLEVIARDRAGAAERSGFDPSREAALARRYEAAAEREVYRALKELRRVEAEAAKLAAQAPEPAKAAEPLGSFRAEAPCPADPAPPPPRPVAPRVPAPRPTPAPVVGEGPGWSQVAVTVGRGTP